MFTTEILQSVIVLRMNRPPVQAMDLEFCRGLADQLDEIEQSPPGAVLLTGSGRVFSAGVDLKRLVAEPPGYVDDFLPALRRLFRTAWEFPPPLVVAINGAALAGGCVLAGCGDWRVLSQAAVIGMPESRVGLPLPAEGIEITRAAVGERTLPRIVGRGEKWSGDAAIEAGLADELAGPAELEAVAMEHARRLAESDPAVFRLGKQQVRHFVSARIDEHHARFGRQVQGHWKSERIRDAVRRFVAERLG